jgi:hypothetical protein
MHGGTTIKIINTNFNTQKFCDINDVLIAGLLQMLRSILMFSSSGLSSAKRNVLRSFENSETPHQGAQRHVLEVLKFL